MPFWRDNVAPQRDCEASEAMFRKTMFLSAPRDETCPRVKEVPVKYFFSQISIERDGCTLFLTTTRVYNCAAGTMRVRDMHFP